MSESENLPQEVSSYVPAPRDEDGDLIPSFVESIQSAIDNSEQDTLRIKTNGLHEADFGDLIEVLSADQRVKLVQLLGKDFDFTVLTELDESIRVSLVNELPTGDVAEGVSELDSDDAAYILDDLDETEQVAILDQISLSERLDIKRVLDFPETSAGRLMQTDYIAISDQWNVGQTIDYMREEQELPDSFYDIFVLDSQHKLKGSVALDKLLRSRRNRPILEILRETVEPVKATEDREVVARMFERYNLVSAAVVDETGYMVGMLTVDDIIDVIEEEVDSDYRSMAGVGDEEISDSILRTVRNRFSWLVINLATAVLASVVIGFFDATIEQMVALAVLMPIVASMGGNAGTQTMTVAVRALATNAIDRYNTSRIILRETSVGMLNGILLAICMGLLAGIWFSNFTLGGIIGVAMVINMIVAGMAGILIPITLNKFNFDPAIASTVFVTTVTDIVGFFAFLGLAAWWFNLAF